MPLDNDINILRKIPTFRVLGPDALRILAISAETVHVRSGEALYEAGDPADCAYVIAAGAVKFRSIGSHKVEELPIARAGSLIGETALIIETERTASASALEPSTLMKITRTIFLRMLEGDADAAAALRAMIARRTQSILDDLELVLPKFENES